MKSIAIVALWLSAIQAAVAAQFLCIADMGTGFLFDRQTAQWKSVDFKVSDSRYILRPVTPEDKSKYENWGVSEDTEWVLVQFGSNDLIAACGNFYGINRHMNQCEAGGASFRFSADSNRFVLTQLGWSGIQQHALLSGERMDYDGKPHRFTEPYLEIGSCSVF